MPPLSGRPGSSRVASEGSKTPGRLRRTLAARRVLPLLATAAAVVLGAGALVTFSGGGGERVAGGGPLACADCHSGASMPMDIGELGTYGAANLENRSKKPAVLDHVEYVERTPGLRILGPLVSRRGDTPAGGVGLIREFPPRQLKGALHSLAGYRVLPFRSFADSVDILVGISPQRKGKLSYRKLKLYYRVGGKRYVATFDMGVRVCAPGSVPLARCPSPLSDKD
jgi:hypothetical protein